MSTSPLSEERIVEIRARMEAVGRHGFLATCRAEVDLYQLGVIDAEWLLAEVSALSRELEVARECHVEKLERAVKAEAEVARLAAERDALEARLAAAEAERDRLIGAITPLGRCLLCEKTVNAHRGWCALAARTAPEEGGL